ncbi:ribonuclease E/G [Salinibacterium sp. dk2585]|uniref:Rne/Rng family ribonuclease n=1 Tax=unclassified Salinibacterium TaxID=2632331 RepID=UPI0011C24C1B|nr:MULTISPECIES: Rne/Rng family ribonuclease [unclassified Salinibacterium]QEE61449.1 ribonuclease E/G [Salinibacterium sp. dk2585]TXK54126.1 ribonuclease E/G [Salinibacterium sp. dk5596]
MVETNENNDGGTQKEGSRRRVRLFGGRKAKSGEAEASQGAVSAPSEERTDSGAEAVTPSVEPAAGSTAAAETRAAEGSEAAAATEPAEDAAADTSATTESQEIPAAPEPLVATSTTTLLFRAPDLPTMVPPRPSDDAEDESSSSRRRTRRRSGDDEQAESERSQDRGPQERSSGRQARQSKQQPEPSNEPQKVRGSTRLEAKKQRRRDGRDAGRRRPVVTEAEFLARRESVDRVMVVRQKNNRIQIGVLEDGVLVEHYVAQSQESSLIGNVYLGRVQNVLPSMEAAFVDIGRGRNAVLYSGEVDWDAAAENSAEGKNQARRIELALKPGDKVLVQVTKDPVGHKGARLTSQVSLPGRYLVYVPNGSMNGISRKLPDTERARLKKILKEVLPDNTGVIVRTAAEGATEEQLTLDVNRLTSQWSAISAAIESVNAPALLHSEPDLLVKIVRDVFNEDFHKLVIEGADARETITSYLRQVAPDLVDRVEAHVGEKDSFDEYRISEQIEKALDRKVWLPSGGSLVIDRTEAMTVVDVNTGKFVGSGGNLEETVTKNNLEAAEEIVRQLRLRDIGGIIVVDFIDMVLESNRDLVLRRLVECLSRDRTKHQVAEVTSLGLVQMTRKKLGLGLLESFSEPCETCAGRGIIVHHDPVTKHRQTPQPESRRGRGGKGGNGNGNGNGSGSGNSNSGGGSNAAPKAAATHAITEDVKNALAQIAASTIANQTAESESAEKSDTEGAQATADATAGSASAEEKPSKSRSRRSRSKGAAESKDADAGDAAAKADATPQAGVKGDSAAEDRTAEAQEEVVEILDIPVVKAPRAARKISSEDAEQILGTVLDALPEPKQPGQGRSRGSRRASSAGVVQAGSGTSITLDD